MDRLPRYEEDFYAWTRAQADALRRAAEARPNADIDWANLAEEIEDVGKSVRRELESRLTVLLVHLLKWMHCPELLDRNARQWRLTIREQRKQVRREVGESGSLRPMIQAQFAEIYGDARERAAVEADVPEDRFPAEPAFALDDALSDAFPPGLDR
jgi:hypothetical protein